MVNQLTRCIENGGVPVWMTKGKTVLIMKDKAKGNIASNYRPITCLPLMWKMLTPIIAEEMYNFLDNNDLLPEGQKGCRKKTRRTNDQLYIDMKVMKDVKKIMKNVSMAWVDYKKAYDMVPHSWIQECMDIPGVADNINRILVESNL